MNIDNIKNCCPILLTLLGTHLTKESFKFCYMARKLKISFSFHYIFYTANGFKSVSFKYCPVDNQIKNFSISENYIKIFVFSLAKTV